MEKYANLTREELEQKLSNMEDFAFCNRIGEEYQDLICHKLFSLGICLNNNTSAKYQLSEGENMAGIEIKHDNKIPTTNRLYIEISAITKKGDNFVDGGIKKVDKSWLYVIGYEEECWIFSKKQLKLLLEKVTNKPQLWWDKYKVRVCDHYSPDGKKTSSGLVIGRETIDKMGLALLHLDISGDNCNVL